MIIKVIVTLKNGVLDPQGKAIQQTLNGMSFNNVSMGQKVYILFCVGMYFYNIYQNVVSCYRFYLNS